MLSSQANDCLEQWKACWGGISFMIPLYRSQSPKIIVVLSLWVSHQECMEVHVRTQVLRKWFVLLQLLIWNRNMIHFTVEKKERKINNLSLHEWGWTTLTSEQFFHSTASYQAILNGSFSHFCTVANIQSVYHQFFLLHSYLCPLCIVTLWRSVPSVAQRLHT